MAIRGQRFTLDPHADDFAFNIADGVTEDTAEDHTTVIGEIRERNCSGIPPPPKPKKTKTGFPQHRPRVNLSAIRPSQSPSISKPNRADLRPREPSDRAILNHVGRKYGIDLESNEKSQISEENKRRIAQMSTQDIDEARSEIMANFSPAFIEKLMKRANIEEDEESQAWVRNAPGVSTDGNAAASASDGSTRRTIHAKITTPQEQSIGDVEDLDSVSKQEVEHSTINPQFNEVTPSIHFPAPPRNPDDYVKLDPNAPSFLSDLRTHYFPELPEDPSTLAWLQDPTEEESKSSPYAPTQSRYSPSDIRFDFAGRILAPNQARQVPVSKGLHHHGEASESAGYTIPELSLLARSSLPNQRCVAYQVLGRILYRLGRGDFGPRGTDLQGGLWSCIEKERSVEVMMSEANRVGGHVSAKAYATEALWLWRKGGGGERGLLKPGVTFAK